MELDSLRKIQREAAGKVVVEDRFKSPLESVAGVDLAFLGENGIASSVVMDYPPTKIIETKTLVVPLTFPYISSYLTFREGPPMIKVMSYLESKVGVFLINGQGISHPLRCGLSSHIGVDSGKPTIGVTTSHLIGEYNHEPTFEGEAILLRIEGEAVGWVLKSRLNSKPIYVSPGHQVSLDSSLKIVKNCLLDHRLPEPLQMAHIVANNEKRRLEATRT